MYIFVLHNNVLIFSAYLIVRKTLLKMSADKTVIRDTHIHEEKHEVDSIDSSSLSSESELGEKKKTGVIQNIKHGIKNVVNTVTGHHDASSNKGTIVEQETANCVDVDEHARNARVLRKQAEATLKSNNKEFDEAQRAQNQARIVAEHANLKTAEALQHQQQGQQLLAEAGKFYYLIYLNHVLFFKVLK